MSYSGENVSATSYRTWVEFTWPQKKGESFIINMNKIKMNITFTMLYHSEYYA